MSVDYFAMGTALAGTMGTATAPAGTMGGTAIRSATVQAPNSLNMAPALIVDLPATSGEVAAANSLQKYIWDWDVYFILDWSSSDEPRVRKALLQWLGPLVEATYGAVTLGATVTKAYVVSARFEEYQYDSGTYPAWHLVVRTWNDAYAAWTP